MASDGLKQPAPSCLCTLVTEKSLEALLEVNSMGKYKDAHPWFIARELFRQTDPSTYYFPIIFAIEESMELAQWSAITDIDVVEYSGDRFETICQFNSLQPVNPIFTALDSLTLMPSAELLHREAVEPIRILRQHLDARQVRPYAICETPAFIAARHAE